MNSDKFGESFVASLVYSNDIIDFRGLEGGDKGGGLKNIEIQRKTIIWMY